jgi:hypothetical protein
MTPLTAATLEAVERYWAADRGCSRADLRSPSTHVVRHADASVDYRGLFMLLVGGAPVVSLLVQGLVPQYRMLESHAPSMRVARTLGFVRYGVGMAVRLRQSSGKSRDLAAGR